MKISFLRLMMSLFGILFFTMLITNETNATNKRISLSYLYFGNPASYTEQIDKSTGGITTVSPNYLNVNENGELVLSWKIRPEFVTQMHQRGIRVVPFLSNHWNIKAGVAALAHRETLVVALAKAINDYGFDGVHIDIEGLNETYRDDFTDFIKKLRRTVSSNKEVSIAVAANPNGWTKGWHGFYDELALSEYSDYLMIMAYDESWEGSESGPVASIDFVRRSIEYSLRQGVPKNKIVIGIPFYGRVWDEFGSIQGVAGSMNQLQNLLRQFEIQELFDESSQSAYSKMIIPSGSNVYLSNHLLKPGTYSVWYENEQSVKAKLRLVNEYNLRGAGTWSLTQETPDTWTYYDLWLNGRFFRDVPSRFWATESILRMADNGWMNGKSSTDFGPLYAMTRAQIAKMLVNVLKLNQKNVGQLSIFNDTKTHPMRREIAIIVKNGLMHGIGNGNFLPNSPMTREQMAVLQANVLPFSNSIEPNLFVDVKSNRWSAQAIHLLAEHNVMRGLDNTHFAPSKPITRAEVAVIMDRLSEEWRRRSQ